MFAVACGFVGVIGLIVCVGVGGVFFCLGLGFVVHVVLVGLIVAVFAFALVLMGFVSSGGWFGVCCLVVSVCDLGWRL